MHSNAVQSFIFILLGNTECRAAIFIKNKLSAPHSATFLLYKQRYHVAKFQKKLIKKAKKITDSVFESLNLQT